MHLLVMSMASRWILPDFLSIVSVIYDKLFTCINFSLLHKEHNIIGVQLFARMCYLQNDVNKTCIL